jgi:hypothetical protein
MIVTVEDVIIFVKAIRSGQKRSDFFTRQGRMREFWLDLHIYNYIIT